MNLCGDCQYLKDNNCEYDQPVCVNLFGRFFTPTEDKRPFLSDEVSKEEIELINKIVKDFDNSGNILFSDLKYRNDPLAILDSELIEFDFMLINSPIAVIRKNGYLNVGTPKNKNF